MERGFFRFTYGQDDAVVDFVHVNNLVEAHILAGKALMEANSIAVSNQKIQLAYNWLICI